MKTTTWMVTAMMLVCLFVGYTNAFASGSDHGDVNVAQGQQQQQEQQQQMQQQQVANGGSARIEGSGNSSNQNENIANGGSANNHNSVNNQVTVRGNLPTVGFAGFLGNGIPMDAEGWVLYAPCTYPTLTMDEVESMRRKFQFSDLFPWNWGSNVQFTPVGKPLAENGNPVAVATYWPKKMANKGDRVLGTVRVLGEPNTPEEVFLGSAVKACKENTGSSRVAMRVRTHKDGVTVGTSVGGSALTTKMSGGGDEGLAFAGGGMIGKNRTRVEDYIEFEALCMNDGSTSLPGQPPVCEMPSPAPVPPVSYTPPPASPVCDPSPILKKIDELRAKIAECKLFCMNNLRLRAALGDAYIDAYVCTGRSVFLKYAASNYAVAERNYLKGHDIKRNQAEADKISARVFWAWSGVIYLTEGEISAMSFAKKHHVERIPKGFK